MQKVEVFGEVPLARFGHTITQGILCKLTFYSFKVQSYPLWWSHWRYWEVYNYW